MIEARDLTHDYPNGLRALQGISFRIAQGELVVLVGPSGAGKTTLLKLLTGVEQPTAGSLVVNGTVMHQPQTKAIRALRRRMGVVFQDFKLFPGRSVAENIALSLILLGISRPEISRRCQQALAAVGLEDKINAVVETLSTGQQQRVAIARALAREPALILADEPTGNLDIEAAAQVMQLLVTTREKGCTVVVVTHSPQLLQHLPHRVLRLEGGQLTCL